MGDMLLIVAALVLAILFVFRKLYVRSTMPFDKRKRVLGSITLSNKPAPLGTDRDGMFN